MSMPGTIIVGLASSSSSSGPETSGGDPDVHLSNTTSVMDESSSSDAVPLSHVGWIIVLVLVALAFGTFLCLAAFLEKLRLGASRNARRAARTTRPKQKSTSERYLEIEKWLVSKRVEAHDETCDHAGGYGGARQHHNSYDDDKAHRQRSLTECTSKTDHSQSSSEGEHLDECSICFDVFQPGEIVSWSPEPKCQHVFHHHCIKEWLLKKKKCPFCRETFLPTDRLETIQNHRKTVHELILAQQRRSVPCFYCVEHGVVRPSRSDCELHDAIRQRSECVPTLEELQQIRGVVDSDNNTNSLHSVPSALSSVDEHIDMEMCHEIQDMSPNAEMPVADPAMSTHSSLVDEVPFCPDVSEHFPAPRGR